MKHRKRKKVAQLQRRSQLNLEKTSPEELFNELAKFMVQNKSRNSATRAEVAKYFDCSFNKATRILNSFVSEGRISRDTEAENLYWLVLE